MFAAVHARIGGCARKACRDILRVRIHHELIPEALLTSCHALPLLALDAGIHTGILALDLLVCERRGP